MIYENLCNSVNHGAIIFCRFSDLFMRDDGLLKPFKTAERSIQRVK